MQQSVRITRIGARPPLHLWPLLLIVAAAMVFGGGGSPAAAPELLVQLITALCLLAMLFGPWRMDIARKPTALAWAAATMILLIPMAQLVPLPPQVWHSMPGRELERQALAIVGAQDQWRSWTIFPARTLASLLAMIPAVIVLLATSRLETQDFKWPIAVVACVSILSLLLGAAQLAGGDQSGLRFYAQSNPGFLNGFQANRNAEADILLIGTVAASALFWMIHRQRKNALVIGLAATAVTLLSLGVILTGSRAGIALLPLALGFSGLLWFGWRRRLLFAIAVLVPVSGIAAWFLQGSSALQKVISRFDGHTDFRGELWTDAMFAINIYWPFGSGIGSAAPVLTMAERLEIVDPTSPNRVHNDYLEFILEAGIFGAVMMAGFVSLVVWAAIRQLRNRDAVTRQIVCLPLAILAIIGLHSIVDYPLRSMSLAIIAAMALGMLLARPAPATRGVEAA